MNDFVRHHRESIRFGYRCFDRMLCNVMIQRLQWPAAVVRFFKDFRQAGDLTPSYFRTISSQYHTWLTERALALGVPIVEPPPKVRREEWVEPFFRSLDGEDGTAVILKCRERARVAVSFPSQGNFIDLVWRYVNVYYFYLQDPLCGRMFVRVCPYFPFNAQVCLNGHQWLARRLRQEGIAFRQKDNAFVDCADPQRLQQLADTFSPEPVTQAVDHILTQWLPYFTPAERERDYRHEVFFSQVEYCDNLIFHSHAALHRLFERLLDLNRSIGQPDKLAVIFGRSMFRADTRTTQTVVKIIPEVRLAVLRSGFQATSIKQYVKDRVLLRTETSTHQLADLSLRKHIRHLPRVREVLAQSNQRYLQAQHDVLATYIDRGQLERLRQPTLSPTGRRTPGLRLDDVRLLAVWQALTCIIHLVGHGTFRTKDLLDSVRQTLERPDYKLSQLRYDLSKLRAKGLVQRLPGTQHYRLTAKGYRVGVLYCKLYHRLYAPMTSALLAPIQPDYLLPNHRRAKLDRLYTALDQSLQKLTDYFGLRHAA
jgi:hypothetical protein